MLTGRRLLVAMGDAESMATWSGTPFHLLAAGRRRGFLHGGLKLEPASAALRARRTMWNAAAFVRSGRPGGYQYSRGFLERVCPVALTRGDDDPEFISHFPLLPSGRERVSFYIDATLRQNFDEYGLGRRIAKSHQADAIARERDQYARAERVVCMSRWAADSVVNEYGVPCTKVHVVRAGANIDEAALARVGPRCDPGRDTLRLGFIGKDWRRKGLPFLLSVAEEIDRRGQAVEVLGIGPSVGEAPAHRLLRVAGYVDKRSELARFASLVRETHFGCLFSRAEALGISSLEFIRLGVPVAGFDVGGIRDCITPDVGLLLPSDISATSVAERLLEAWQPASHARLLAATVARAPEVTWDEAVAALERIWGIRT